MTEQKPEQGTYENPIDHDYNVENLENAEKQAADSSSEDNVDDSDSSNPEPVDGTAEGASNDSYNPDYGG